MFRKAREIDFNLTLLTVADTHNSLNTFKEIKIPKSGRIESILLEKAVFLCYTIEE